MPDRANIVYKVSKPAPGPEVITSFGAQHLSIEFMLFINVKKCWHLNSILKSESFSM